MRGFQTGPLGFPWHTRDPFLFCVHHLDHYPKGNADLGPAAPLDGRDIGMDFAGKDGWRMYHGRKVPGFPAHPHRGFETVTLARRGHIDHSDSLGAAARFGHGDVQWMTAGKGIVHSEMFPLLDPEQPNTAELFQIWLNLPAASKMVDPHFSMLWSHMIPTVVVATEGSTGPKAEVVVVAGRFGDASGPPPPPDSWAARADSDVGIWTIRLDPGAMLTLPAARDGTARSLYFFVGDRITVDGQPITEPQYLDFNAPDAVKIENGEAPAELLMLQGRPIREPVAHHGPFVMNTRQELFQAMVDYQQTRFGGWPWDDEEPVHAKTAGRFARHADGKVERMSLGDEPADQ